MGLLWFDGFESYNDYLDVHVHADFDGCPTNKVIFGVGYGRNDGRGMRINDVHGKYRPILPSTHQTIITGFALRLAETPSYNSSYPFLGIYDGLPTATGSRHLKFHFNSSRLLEVRDNSAALIVTGTIPVTGSVWNYVEIKVTISNTVGQITTKINGVEDINTTANKDTCNGSNEYAKVLEFSRVQEVSGTDYDDMYIIDTSGAKNNDFLGDIRIDPLRPNAAGTYTDFTPSAGANYANVDETYGPDDDTTYNDGANVGDQDSYQMPDLPAPAGTTIYGVKSQITVRKTDAGAMKCKLLTRAGITDDLGDEIILSDSYTTHAEILEDNPDDAAAWADADVNGMEVGVEITA